MLEIVSNAFAALQQEASLYPQHIQIWMKLMAVSFLLSLLFVYNKRGARWILLAFVINVVGLVAGKIAFPELSRADIGTYVHLLFWPAILWMIWRPGGRPSPSERIGLRDTAYWYWIIFSSVIMSVSLLLDFRNLLSSLT